LRGRGGGGTMYRAAWPIRTGVVVAGIEHGTSCHPGGLRWPMAGGGRQRGRADSTWDPALQPFTSADGRTSTRRSALGSGTWAVLGGLVNTCSSPSAGRTGSVLQGVRSSTYTNAADGSFRPDEVSRTPGARAGWVFRGLMQYTPGIKGVGARRICGQYNRREVAVRGTRRRARPSASGGRPSTGSCVAAGTRRRPGATRPCSIIAGVLPDRGVGTSCRYTPERVVLRNEPGLPEGRLPQKVAEARSWPTPGARRTTSFALTRGVDAAQPMAQEP